MQEVPLPVSHHPSAVASTHADTFPELRIPVIAVDVPALQPFLWMGCKPLTACNSKSIHETAISPFTIKGLGVPGCSESSCRSKPPRSQPDIARKSLLQRTEKIPFIFMKVTLYESYCADLNSHTHKVPICNKGTAATVFH